MDATRVRDVRPRKGHHHFSGARFDHGLRANSVVLARVRVVRTPKVAIACGQPPFPAVACHAGPR